MYITINIFFILSILFYTSFISAAPTIADIRATCEDISNIQTPDPRCWFALGMNVWIMDWMIAVEDGKAAEPCQPNEAWANCFMRLTLNDPTVTCTGPGTCPYPTTTGKQSLMMQGPDRARVWHAAYMIWFFHEYISRLHALLETHVNEPTVELERFLAGQIWSHDPTFQVLNSQMADVMNDLRVGKMWTGNDANSIQTGLWVLLQHQFKDLNQKQSPRRFNFLYTAKDGALLQNWSCLQGVLCKGKV